MCSNRLLPVAAGYMGLHKASHAMRGLLITACCGRLSFAAFSAACATAAF